MKWLVVHCSATPVTRDYTVAQLRHDHVDVNGWDDIGYHYYITKDGRIHACRPENVPGAHVKGFNKHSIGICYEGGIMLEGVDVQVGGKIEHRVRAVPCDTRTAEQVVSMYALLSALKLRYPDAKIVGHRDLLRYKTKSCPCFDASREYQTL